MASKTDNLFVVKVQISLESSDGLSHVLIYDKSRETMAEFEFPDKESIDMIGLDSSVPKSYWIAQLADDPNVESGKHIQLLERIKDEAW